MYGGGATFYKVSFAFGVQPGQDSTEALAQALYRVARLAGAAFWSELDQLDQDMWKQLAETMIADETARNSAKVVTIPQPVPNPDGPGTIFVIPHNEDARDPKKRAWLNGE